MLKPNSREERALIFLSQFANEFVASVRLPAGIGHGTMTGLVKNGWALSGKAAWRGGTMGWRITRAGRAALEAC